MSLLKKDPNEVVRSGEFWAFIAGAACSNQSVREQLKSVDPSQCTLKEWRPMIDALRVANGKTIWSILHEKWGLSPEQAKTTAEAALHTAREFAVRHSVRREMLKLLVDDNWAWEDLDTVGRSLLEIVDVISKRPSNPKGRDGDTVQPASDVAAGEGVGVADTEVDPRPAGDPGLA